MRPLAHSSLCATSCILTRTRIWMWQHIYSCPVLSRTTGLFDIPAMDCNTVRLRVLCIQVKRIRQVENWKEGNDMQHTHTHTCSFSCTHKHNQSHTHTHKCADPCFSDLLAGISWGCSLCMSFSHILPLWLWVTLIWWAERKTDRQSERERAIRQILGQMQPSKEW